MLGGSCSPCCTITPYCNSFSNINTDADAKSSGTLTSNGMLIRAFIKKSESCGGVNGSEGRVASACVISIPSGKSAVMSVFGSSPATSYVMFGLTEVNSTAQAQSWLSGQRIYQLLNDALFEAIYKDTSSWTYILESKNNYPRTFVPATITNECSSLASTDKSYAIGPQQTAKFYGVDFVIHGGKFGPLGYPDYNMTASVAW